MRHRIARLLAAPLLGTLLLTACSADGSSSGPTLTVLAAASLREPFTELGQRFEAEHDGLTVRFSFAGSSDLVAQVQQGAPADVLATADEETMGRALDDELVAGRPVPFATNRLVVAVPPDNPARITSVQDLAGDDVAVVVCAPVVPCGAATVRVEQASGVELDPVSEEGSVTDVLNKVTTGEADAGLVYASDVRRAGDRVLGITLPAELPATNVYPVASLAGSEHAELARAFVALVTGEAGREVLVEAGLGAIEQGGP